MFVRRLKVNRIAKSVLLQSKNNHAEAEKQTPHKYVVWFEGLRGVRLIGRDKAWARMQRPESDPIGA
jgi:hypothetical protein